MGGPNMIKKENDNTEGYFSTAMATATECAARTIVFFRNNPTATVATTVAVASVAKAYQSIPTVPVRVAALEVNEAESNWMRNVPDDTYIRDMSIPGTHDSVTGYNLVSGALGSIGGIDRQTAQCQYKGITEQLNDGIRFLDIRLKLAERVIRGKKENYLCLLHGTQIYEGDFLSIWDECIRFLTAHPEETILMSIKNEDTKKNPEFLNKLHSLLSRYKNNYTLNKDLNKNLTLKECRGKVVIFKRYTDDNPISRRLKGFDLSKEEWDSAQKGNNEDFSIEDTFQLITRKNKANKVKQHVEGNIEKIKISFNSLAFITPKALLGQGSPYSNAQTLNSSLFQNLKNFKNPLGIVVLDFYDCIDGKSDFSSDLVSKIIKMNPRK